MLKELVNPDVLVPVSAKTQSWHCQSVNNACTLPIPAAMHFNFAPQELAVGQVARTDMIMGFPMTCCQR